MTGQCGLDFRPSCVCVKSEGHIIEVTQMHVQRRMKMQC